MCDDVILRDQLVRTNGAPGSFQLWGGFNTLPQIPFTQSELGEQVNRGCHHILIQPIFRFIEYLIIIPLLAQEL